MYTCRKRKTPRKTAKRKPRKSPLKPVPAAGVPPKKAPDAAATARGMTQEGKVPMSLNDTKACSRCRETLPYEAFNKCSARADGLQNYCRECARGAFREWTDANPEWSRERVRRYYAENRDARLAYNAAYYAEHKGYWTLYRVQNPDVSREAQRRYRERNLDRVAASLKAWHAKNPLKRREHENRRKARKLATQSTPVDYAAILARDGYVCHLCGGDVPPGDVHFDHVIPLARGGAHANENIRVAHSRCNLVKHAKYADAPAGGKMKEGAE